MNGRVIALGFFDGVHIGHGALFKLVRKRAEELSLSPAVLTYSSHPSNVLLKKPVKLINTTEERKMLISGLYGINDIIIKEFDRQYADLTCREFVENILIGECKVRHVVAGYDFRFGRGGKGDAGELSSLCASFGCGCDIAEPVCVDGRAVSSTAIRELIARGEVKEAQKLLGHRHSIISKTEHGRRLGGGLGFPTVNQSFSEEVQVPKFGVYSSRTFIRGKEYRSVTDIGVRPTVSEDGAVRAETNILDFSGELYGETVHVELCEFLREEMRFASLGELKSQIARDVRRVREEK